jgi:hypothetical protein
MLMSLVYGMSEIDQNGIWNTNINNYMRLVRFEVEDFSKNNNCKSTDN